MTAPADTREETSAELPGGNSFTLWQDETDYTRAYHVAREHPKASDANPGTEEAPLATIQRAADLAQPGQIVVIHRGTYRECVKPRRGGTDSAHMIAYESGKGETVTLKGSEVWRPVPQPSEGWQLRKCDHGATIWMADLPEGFFRAYNPFALRNSYQYFFYFGKRDDPEWVKRTLLRRGTIFFEGQPLRQVSHPSELAGSDNVFWVEEPGLRVHFRLPGDRNPSGSELEVTAREQVFAPDERNLGYVRVSGLALQHGADGIPVPQRGCLSTNRGHHWIIEDCRIEWVNGCGMDIGCQTWDAVPPAQTGHHLVRRNTVRRCGICGVAGSRGVVHTLIEDNCFEHIGYHDLERVYESAGIKFHFCENSLIRRNVFRHFPHAGGVWLDVENFNCRITNNVFADIDTITAAVYSEMNYGANMVDHNLFWDIRSGLMSKDQETYPAEGSAARADCNENLLVAHNFFGRIQACAVALSLDQADRRVSGRTGVCRANASLANVFFRCPHRLQLGRREENRSDWNLYDSADDNCAFHIVYPPPASFQNLDGWQRFFGLDAHSTQAAIEADFDVDTLTLTWRVQGGVPAGKATGPDQGRAPETLPGPFGETQWKRILQGEQQKQHFPVN